MFPLTCLETLINIICSNEYIMEYFAGLPGVTYLWARYTDWIRPQCNQMIASQSATDDLKEQAAKIMTKFEKYEKYLAKIDGTRTPVEIEKEFSEQFDLQIEADEEK
jgi:hypothetical protein